MPHCGQLRGSQHTAGLTCLTSRHNNPTLAGPINLIELFNKPKSICHRDFSSCGSRRGSQFEYHQDVSHCELQLQFSQNHFEPRVLRGTDLSQTAQFALIAQIWTLKTVNIYLHATPAWTAWSQEHWKASVTVTVKSPLCQCQQLKYICLTQVFISPSHFYQYLGPQVGGSPLKKNQLELREDYNLFAELMRLGLKFLLRKNIPVSDMFFPQDGRRSRVGYSLNTNSMILLNS